MIKIMRRVNNLIKSRGLIVTKGPHKPRSAIFPLFTLRKGGENMSKEEKIQRLVMLFDAFGIQVLEALDSGDYYDVLYELSLRSKMNE